MKKSAKSKSTPKVTGLKIRLLGKEKGSKKGIMTSEEANSLAEALQTTPKKVKAIAAEIKAMTGSESEAQTTQVEGGPTAWDAAFEKFRDDVMASLVSHVARKGNVEGISSMTVERAVKADLIVLHEFGKTSKYLTRPKGRKLLIARFKRDSEALTKYATQ